MLSLYWLHPLHLHSLESPKQIIILAPIGEIRIIWIFNYYLQVWIESTWYPEIEDFDMSRISEINQSCQRLTDLANITHKFLKISSRNLPAWLNSEVSSLRICTFLLWFTATFFGKRINLRNDFSLRICCLPSKRIFNYPPKLQKPEGKKRWPKIGPILKFTIGLFLAWRLKEVCFQSS